MANLRRMNVQALLGLRTQIDRRLAELRTELEKQLDALNKAISDRLAISRTQSTQQRTPTSPHPGSATVSPTTSDQEHHLKVFAHVSDAYSHWKCLPEKTRQETWQLEILR